jgi:ABC-type multidrug transport system fused ATPase/permease subunit
MSSSRSIAYATDAQDLALLSVSAELKKNPQQLYTFLQSQQQAVIDNITRQKEDTYSKVYGDLDRSFDEQKAVQGYNTQTTKLSSLYDNIYDNQSSYANTLVQNKDTYGRKYEMNEWTIQNKKDTLFVFSSLFIVLSFFILLAVLFKMNLISPTVCYITGSVAIIIFILIVINRAQYTDLLRNKRYWNKKNFGGKYGTIPIPSICPPVGATS